ncbi:hypothetical protein F4809DRAFT_343519 [Biscogniauxia mediterranea]|nr:hypothetical protein F4809DRAFT_343519 [Biscogniauxia mediterranea]
MDPNMTYTYFSGVSSISTSPPGWAASTPMARGPSHGSESSEYSMYSSSNSDLSNSQFDMADSPGSEDHCSTTNTGNYVMNSESSADVNQQNTLWFQFYDFVISGEVGQGPYWRLKDGYTPSRDYPAIIKTEQDSNIPRSASESQGLHVCLTPFCTASPFKRKADLERHYRHKHQSVDQKEPFYCDFKRCARSKEPFFRLDHCRDHYRDYHCDDLVRRGASHKEDRDWWQSRRVDARWWRCTKCLARIAIDAQGFECPRCKTTCEAERRKIRGYE